MTRPDVRFRLRDMREEDLAFVVEQHLYHFPDGFFARLGRRFLREYYRSLLTGPAAVTTVAEVSGRPAGYLVGVTAPVEHREHVLSRHGRRLALCAAIGMLLRPSTALCFLRTRAGRYAKKLLRRGRACAPVTRPTGEAPAVLTHVAVAPTAQDNGVGSALIERFEHEAACAGCDRLVLVTASGEDGAGPYYRRRGWRAVEEHRTPDGLRLTTFDRPVRQGAARMRTGTA
jgi:ribosomal protein S18 acetylase RimI-like enzyme